MFGPLWPKLPARPAKPGDTISLWRAFGPSKPPTAFTAFREPWVLPLISARGGRNPAEAGQKNGPQGGMTPLRPRMGKTMRMERAAFLAAFGRSQRLRGCAAAQVLGHRREAPARWAVARSAKRPAGGPRNERWARPAPSATIERAKPEARARWRKATRKGCARQRTERRYLRGQRNEWWGRMGKTMQVE